MDLVSKTLFLCLAFALTRAGPLQDSAAGNGKPPKCSDVKLGAITTDDAGTTYIFADGPQRHCERHKISIQAKGLVIGAFLPQCDENGHYQPQQSEPRMTTRPLPRVERLAQEPSNLGRIAHLPGGAGHKSAPGPTLAADSGQWGHSLSATGLRDSCLDGLGVLRYGKDFLYFVFVLASLFELPRAGFAVLCIACWCMKPGLWDFMLFCLCTTPVKGHFEFSLGCFIPPGRHAGIFP